MFQASITLIIDKMSKYKVLEFRFTSSPEFKQEVVRESRKAVESVVEKPEQFNLFPRYERILIPRQFLEDVRDSLSELLDEKGLQIEEFGDRLRVIKKEDVVGWGAPYFNNED